jgi:hypothetical protein
MSLETSIDRAADIHARLQAAEAALAAIGQRVSPHVAELDIAVLIPCCNQASTIADVVSGFRAALPGARVYVYDNNSTDGTAAKARDAGAIVRREPLQGKAQVLRRMFADIEADIYVMVDGDGTYDPAAAPRLISRLVETGADMVVAARITQEKAAYESGRPGDRLLSRLVARLFEDRFTDMLSGYRVFSRRFVKSYPATDIGFTPEAAFAAHALELGVITSEIQATYFARPGGSASRSGMLREYARIGAAAAGFVREERPMLFFAGLAAPPAVLAAGLAASAVAASVQAAPGLGLSTTLAFGTLSLLAALSLVCGAVLESLNRARRETRRLAYSSHESLTAKLDRLEETRAQLSGSRIGARSERIKYDLTRFIEPRRNLGN